VIRIGSWSHGVQCAFAALLRRYHALSSFAVVGTPLQRQFFRCLGARIDGRGAFLAFTEAWLHPELVEVGAGCFVGDFSQLCTVAYQHDADGMLEQRLDAVCLGERTLVGMNAVIHPGSHIPSHCVVGAGTAVTPQLQAHMQAEVQRGMRVRTLFGQSILTAAPPTAGDEEATAMKAHFPRFALGWFSLLVGAPLHSFALVLCMVPAALSSVHLWSRLAAVSSSSAWWCLLPLHAVVYWPLLLGSLLWTIVFKWMLFPFGMRAGTCDVESLYFWRRAWVGQPLQLAFHAMSGGMWAGFAMLNLFYRLLGARVPVSVHLLTASITEPDLIRIGAHSCVEEHSVLFAHAVEAGKLTMQTTRIGAHASLATHACTLYGASVGDATHLEAESVAMKGQRMGALAAEGQRMSPPRTLGDAFVGVPAARRHARNEVAKQYAKRAAKKQQHAPRSAVELVSIRVSTEDDFPSSPLSPLTATTPSMTAGVVWPASPSLSLSPAADATTRTEHRARIWSVVAAVQVTAAAATMKHVLH
jgi:non-ribosomal peptide synthetase-like protein